MFNIQGLFQRCADITTNVYTRFIDNEKAFDTVQQLQHDKMLVNLSEFGLDGRDVHIIANLYWQQNATVCVDGELSETMNILRGVRQGCVLSPLLLRELGLEQHERNLSSAVLRL